MAQKSIPSKRFILFPTSLIRNGRAIFICLHHLLMAIPINMNTNFIDVIQIEVFLCFSFPPFNSILMAHKSFDLSLIFPALCIIYNTHTYNIYIFSTVQCHPFNIWIVKKSLTINSILRSYSLMHPI